MTETLHRLAIGIEYDGSGFRGWQTQKEARTLQVQVEKALSRVADEPISVTCAGRTDAGVHATGQIIHFDTSAVRDPRAWLLGGNSHLSPELSFQWVRPMPDDFHARFSARWRRYRYIFLNRLTRPAILRRRVTWIHRPLDAALMAEAVPHLLGEHDFSSFRAKGCQARTPIRTVQAVSVHRRGDFIHLDIRANAFLHHMVRNIAGVLMAIGRGEYPPEWMAEVLTARDRSQAGVTAPPDGLYLVQVGYEDRFDLHPPAVVPEYA
ncbi:tRNA pseudouridine(38-40) synthase TruA [Ectothiorhodospira variabilis]|uniref:tRNA pseudouridine(38-40) synthase TruA n=1 Tax=Ectothiorhodospira variabilis TaxID=505694 RepID=UPI001EFB57A7|nr:tRNA pseudouridine(38-40) synthase TruA [Ectothiorhodospira variabilis]MCG5495307.1 tRNA pseudouridine(38-40) synthase TruA [Ectothiorhodospira variabilis]MCG5497452.1 tRNA pseudouridine(38-40) synthase TruA [Ectothiorhodospira variabilis]MCG5504905.1 tRNA pseudouridine(38-40) synthase TruA [Ectothiorhodospira variabilis]MCG5508062.1 tRNA pseudouridine(38-40) synthase TruA [Ectothiorhodospira variabilis]